MLARQSSITNIDLPLDVRMMRVATALLAAVLAVMLVVALCWWSVRLPLFSLRGVTVVGDTDHTNAVTLRANVLPRLSGNFFTLDLAQARAAFQAVPWVRQAVVRRDFPNRLKVILQEHKAVAIWGPEADTHLLNSFGEVFDAAADDGSDSLPHLSGPNNQSKDVWQMYQALLPLIAPLDVSVQGVSLSTSGNWEMQLDNGGVVEMGRADPPEILARVSRLVQTLTQVASRYGRRAGPDLEYADLRYRDGYALRLRDVTTISAAQGPASR